MYVEKDNTGKIIIQDISQLEAEILDDCICTYLSLPSDQKVTAAEITMRKLKVELCKHLKDVY